MSIKQDSKTIVRNTVAIPTKLLAAALSGTAELSNLGVDAISLSVDAIKGAPAFAAGIGNIFGKFITGMANSDLTPEEAAAVYESATIAGFIKNLEAGAITSGQDFVKDTITDVDLATDSLEKEV